MGVAPDGYLRRIVDEQIARYLTLFGAVEVSGTKWCGKTWSSLNQASSVLYVDRGSNLEICEIDPSYALAGEVPHVIDEWQRVPQIWDTVRHAIDDAGGKPGMWIMTGSSTPTCGHISHSGAGRIGRIRMHPMTLLETGESSGEVSLRGLFQGKFSPCQCEGSIVNLARIATRGGWPSQIKADPADAQIVVREYVALICENGVVRLGGSPDIAERLCLSLARNLGQSATNSTLARDVYALSSKTVPSDVEMRRVSEHLSILTDVYMVDEIAGWVPSTRSPLRMRTKPKRFFADPSIAVAILGTSTELLLEDAQTFGLVFENLCMRDLDVYARSIPEASAHPVKYYRDDSGLEVDAIVELNDGRWGAFEMKLNPQKADEAAKALLRMKAKVLKNKAAQGREPEFLAVLTGTGDGAYKRTDGVLVIPIRALGV